MTVTVRPARENHQPFSALWRFEQGAVIIGDENGMRTNAPRRLRRAGRCRRLGVAFDEPQFLPFGCGENLESAPGSAGAPATHLHDAIDRFVVAEWIMVGDEACPLRRSHAR